MTAVHPPVPVPPAADEAPRPEALELGDEETTLVAAEATAAAKVLPDPLRGQALALAEAAAAGVVPVELIEALEYVLTTSLAGGRARQRYRAEGEALLNGVLARTPAGRARKASVEEVNRALTALAGKELHSVRVGTRVPGSHTVRLDVDGLVLTLGLSAAGVTVESVAL